MSLAAVSLTAASLAALSLQAELAAKAGIAVDPTALDRGFAAGPWTHGRRAEMDSPLRRSSGALTDGLGWAPMERRSAYAATDNEWPNFGLDALPSSLAWWTLVRAAFSTHRPHRTRARSSSDLVRSPCAAQVVRRTFQHAGVPFDGG